MLRGLITTMSTKPPTQRQHLSELSGLTFCNTSLTPLPGASHALNYLHHVSYMHECATASDFVFKTEYIFLGYFHPLNVSLYNKRNYFLGRPDGYFGNTINSDNNPLHNVPKLNGFRRSFWWPLECYAQNYTTTFWDTLIAWISICTINANGFGGGPTDTLAIMKSLEAESLSR